MEWIETKNKMPEEDLDVLIQYDGKVTLGYYAKYGKWVVLENMRYSDPVDWDGEYNIEKWMNLPKI